MGRGENVDLFPDGVTFHIRIITKYLYGSYIFYKFIIIYKAQEI